MQQRRAAILIRRFEVDALLEQQLEDGPSVYSRWAAHSSVMAKVWASSGVQPVEAGASTESGGHVWRGTGGACFRTLESEVLASFAFLLWPFAVGGSHWSWLVGWYTVWKAANWMR